MSQGNILVSYFYFMVMKSALVLINTAQLSFVSEDSNSITPHDRQKEQ